MSRQPKRRASITQNDDPLAFLHEPPDHLSDEALEVWDDLSGPLQSAGLLTDIDVWQFASYCQWEGRALFYERELARIGSHTKKNSNDTQTTRPEFKFAKDSAKMASKLGQQFGLTPRARRSLGIRLKAKQETDPRSSLLTRRS